MPFTFLLMLMQTAFRYGMVRPGQRGRPTRTARVVGSCTCVDTAASGGHPPRCARHDPPPQEFQRNPQAAAARQYTQLARWRLRELNEYPHNLERRSVGVQGRWPRRGRWVVLMLIQR